MDIRILGLLFKIYGSLFCGKYLDNVPEDFQFYAGMETGIELEEFDVKPYLEASVMTEMGSLEGGTFGYPLRTTYGIEGGIRLGDNIELGVGHRCRHGHHAEWDGYDWDQKGQTYIEGRIRF